MKKKYKGETKFERILPYDPPIDYTLEWVGPFIKVLSMEELKRFYPKQWKKLNAKD